MTFRKSLSVFVGLAVAAGGVIIVNQQSEVPTGTRFAVSSFAVYDSLHRAGWDISGSPRWKPDSTAVLFDREGNIPFTPGQLDGLSDLNALVIAESGIVEYLADNNWEVQEE